MFRSHLAHGAWRNHFRLNLQAQSQRARWIDKLSYDNIYNPLISIKYSLPIYFTGDTIKMEDESVIESKERKVKGCTEYTER